MTRRRTNPSIFDVCLPGLDPATATPDAKQLSRNMQCELDRAKQLFEKTVKGIVIWSKTHPLFLALRLYVSNIPRLADERIFARLIDLPVKTAYLRAGEGSLSIIDCNGALNDKSIKWLEKHPHTAEKCCIRYIDLQGNVHMMHYCPKHKTALASPAQNPPARIKTGTKYGTLTVVGYTNEPVGVLDPQHDLGEYRYASATPNKDLIPLLKQKAWGVMFTFGKRCTCVFTLHPDPDAPFGGVAVRLDTEHICKHCLPRYD